jgi:tRNA pseudouridine13 synthase
MFSVVARGLHPSVAQRLAAEGQRTLHFLNYYDLQRFGLPGWPKVTHRVGEALVEGDYEAALGWLRRGQEVDPRQAANGAARYFEALEDRVVAFYMSSYESYLWNERLAEAVRRWAVTGVEEVTREGIPIALMGSERERLAVLREVGTLPHARFRVRGGEICREMSERSTVVQAHVRFADARQDGEDWRCTCSFYLPPGCYATMLMLQLSP